MKKYAIASLATVVALVLPATVGAAAKTYSGTVEPGGTIQFKVKKTNNGKKVKPTLFLNVPADCTSGDETVSGNVPVPGKVQGGEFQINAVVTGFDSKLKITGEINGDSADGTIRVHGSEVLANGESERQQCDTGTVDWSAEKVPSRKLGSATAEFRSR